MAVEPDAEHELDDKTKKPGDAGGKSFLKAHRDQILIVLTLTGVIIAYLAFRKPTQTATADPSSTSYDPTAAAGVPNVGGPSGGGGAIDGFAANLSHMSDLLAQLEANAQDGTSTSTPSPFDYSSMNHSWANEPATAAARFLYGRAASGLHYIRNRRTGRIGQVNPNGKVFWLSSGQYAELGKPKVVDYGRKPAPPKKIKAPPRRRLPVGGRRPTPVK